jgi:major membrane immunogen (membrane-anchored lipoprotein)
MCHWPIIVANSGSDLIIFGHCCKTFAEQCGRTLADGSVEITISTFDDSEQLMFVQTLLRDGKDTFHSSIGNVYTKVK